MFRGRIELLIFKSFLAKKSNKFYGQLNSRTNFHFRIVECAFGALKNRFRCLLDNMELEPAFACEVFKACCVLHNMMVSPQDVTDADRMLDEGDEQAPVR